MKNKKNRREEECRRQKGDGSTPWWQFSPAQRSLTKSQHEERAWALLLNLSYGNPLPLARPILDLVFLHTHCPDLSHYSVS